MSYAHVCYVNPNTISKSILHIQLFYSSRLVAVAPSRTVSRASRLRQAPTMLRAYVLCVAVAPSPHRVEGVCCLCLLPRRLHRVEGVCCLCLLPRRLHRVEGVCCLCSLPRRLHRVGCRKFVEWASGLQGRRQLLT
eukprot:g71189.t1